MGGEPALGAMPPDGPSNQSSEFLDLSVVICLFGAGEKRAIIFAALLYRGGNERLVFGAYSGFESLDLSRGSTAWFREQYPMSRLSKKGNEWLSEAFALPMNDLSASQLAETMNTVAGARPDGTRWDETDFYFKDPELRMVFANVALTLNSSSIDDPVRRAFKETGLEPQNPLHWRILLQFFCYAHFGLQRKAGRPPRTDQPNLLYEVAVLKGRNHTLSTNSALKTLQKKGVFKKSNGDVLSINRLGKIYRAAQRARTEHLNEKTVNWMLQYARSRNLNWTEGEVRATMKTRRKTSRQRAILRR
jgi:hypothetical protein